MVGSDAPRGPDMWLCHSAGSRCPAERRQTDRRTTRPALAALSHRDLDGWMDVQSSCCFARPTPAARQDSDGAPTDGRTTKPAAAVLGRPLRPANSPPCPHSTPTPPPPPHPAPSPPLIPHPTPSSGESRLLLPSPPFLRIARQRQRDGRTSGWAAAAPGRRPDNSEGRTVTSRPAAALGQSAGRPARRLGRTESSDLLLLRSAVPISGISSRAGTSLR